MVVAKRFNDVISYTFNVHNEQGEEREMRITMWRKDLGEMYIREKQAWFGMYYVGIDGTLISW